MTPYWSNGIADLYHADARQVPLADKSVHCVCTSPPYFNLRVYQDNDARGIGLEASVEAYLNSMMEGMAEVWRVLRDDGVCWVNLGDSYGHGTSAGRVRSPNDGLGEGTMNAQNSVHRNGAEAGQLLGIPWRFALRMQEAGWILRQDIIWDKAAPMPESLAGTRWERCRVKVGGCEVGGDIGGKAMLTGEGRKTGVNSTWLAQWQDCPGCAKCEANDGLVLRRGSWRCTSAHEIIFMFVKQMGYWSDGEAVKLPAQYGRRDWNGHVHYKGGDIAARHGGTTTGADPEAGANRRSVWKDIKPEPYGGSHFATFPSSLPRICIQASTSEAGCCPHCGAQWARVMNRESHYAKREAAHVPNNCSTKVDSTGWSEPTIAHLGWRPTCQCPEHKPIPATVFDPFGGTGTTCLAAQRLGRRSVMTDLSESYLQQAIKRLSGATLPLGL